MNPPLHYAVIGAGIAGLSCARALAESGVHVPLVDERRGPGGRMRTRGGEGWACDHGAQYFAARDPLSQGELARWQAAGVAARWQPRLTVFDAAGRRADGGEGGEEQARHV